MPWFKVDDNLAFHHKVVAAGNPAIGLWVRAGSLCAQQLTDGFIPDHMIPALGTPAQAQKLATVGLWDRVEGGYRFHGWAERQPSKASVEAERVAAQERMRAYRAKKKGVSSEASAQVTGSRAEGIQPNERRTNGEVQRSFGDPDPTRPDPTRPVVEEASEADAPDSRATPARALVIVEPQRDDVTRLCEHLVDRIVANGSKRPTITKGWRDAARLLLDRDGRPEAEVHQAIEWCQADQFWRSNVLSMPKLRDKYDAMRLQAARNPRPRGNDIDWDLAMERARQMGATS